VLQPKELQEMLPEGMGVAGLLDAGMQRVAWQLARFILISTTTSALQNGIVSLSSPLEKE
jgi:hypothetical protein